MRQVRNCFTYMSAAVSQKATAQLLAYSTSTTTETWTRADIFLVKDEADCGVTSCSLVTQDAGGSCTSTAFTDAAGNIVKETNDDITVKRNIVAGYGPHNVCYRCTSNL